MNCPRCATDNESVRKYCRSCGAPMGVLCDRCGHVNGAIDLYCASCGFSLIATVTKRQEQNDSSSPGSPPGVRQYSMSELEEMLALRKFREAETERNNQLNQEEIDSLFP